MNQSPTTVNVDVNTPVGLVLTILGGLIAGIEMNSSIPPQLSELRTMHQLLTADYMSRNKEAWQPINNTPRKIEPRRMGIYPTLESLQSVVDLARGQLPSVPLNTIMSLFMTYHNTLLSELEKNNVQ